MKTLTTAICLLSAVAAAKADPIQFLSAGSTCGGSATQATLQSGSCTSTTTAGIEPDSNGVSLSGGYSAIGPSDGQGQTVGVSIAWSGALEDDLTAAATIPFSWDFYVSSGYATPPQSAFLGGISWDMEVQFSTGFSNDTFEYGGDVPAGFAPGGTTTEITGSDLLNISGFPDFNAWSVTLNVYADQSASEPQAVSVLVPAGQTLDFDVAPTGSSAPEPSTLLMATTAVLILGIRVRARLLFR